MGLDMNVNKTKTVLRSRNQDTDVNITIDGNQLEQVKSFKYLEQNVKEDGKGRSEVKSRIEIARYKFSQMKIFFTSLSISMTTKTRLLRCYVPSLLLYGSDI